MHLTASNPTVLFWTAWNNRTHEYIKKIVAHLINNQTLHVFEYFQWLRQTEPPSSSSKDMQIYVLCFGLVFVYILTPGFLSFVWLSLFRIQIIWEKERGRIRRRRRWMRIRSPPHAQPLFSLPASSPSPWVEKPWFCSGSHLGLHILCIQITVLRPISLYMF